MQCRECQAVLPPEARFCLSCGARVPVAVETSADPLLEALDKAIGFQYRIERLLGRGGMGAVYLAHELALDRPVAIKVLPPEHASTPEVRERFKREARTAARLSHPNIVPLHTFGEVAGMTYFVMGYVAGESLDARLRREGALDAETARTFVAAICDALDYAHRQGIVHRDIKPDNILIDTSGVPMLTDFGIAKSVLIDSQLTTTGQSIGTPLYMSPEQALGRADVGPRSDLYSLGVVAYELVSGARPFQAETPLGELTQRLTKEPRPLGAIAPHVPPDYVRAVQRCLHRDPAARWPDARALREALLPSDEEPEDSFPARALRTIVTVVPLVLIAIGWASVYAVLHPDTPSRWMVAAGLMSAILPLGLGAIVMSVRLRVSGMDLQTILRNVLLQPRWWRTWYPRALRRPGDVWSRLPREIRRFRSVRGVGKAYVFGVLMPLFAMPVTRHLLVLQVVLWSMWVVCVSMIWTTHNRATKVIRARTGVTANEASSILNTPTWRASAWRREPAAALLRDGSLRPGPKASTAEPVGLGPAVAADRSTRVS